MRLLFTTVQLTFFVLAPLVAKAQLLADFENGSSSPALSPTGAEIRSNPDRSALNPSNHVAFYHKPSGNWHAIYLDFDAMLNVGAADQLSFLIRSSTAGRVYVKIVKGATTILESWAPDYGSMPQPSQWTKCTVDLSSIAGEDFDRIEVNASVDNNAEADVYVDDFRLSSSLSPNGEPVPVVASFDNTIAVGETITFDGSGSFDTDGWLFSLVWIFEDGTTSQGTHASHTFNVEGINFVRLVLTDNEGKKGVRIIPVYVQPSGHDISAVRYFNNVFRTNEKIEGGFIISRGYNNVYDPDEVTVDAVITFPDQTIRTVPAFYYTKAVYKSAGDNWARDDDHQHWMFRMTSDQEGSHTVTIRLKDADGTVERTVAGFVVVGGDAKGIIRRDPAHQQHYRHATGEPYYPLGINAGWDNTSDYAKIIANLGDGGANLLRYWQVPFDRQGLEWENGNGFYQGLGRYSQEAAAEQDSVLSLCEANGLYLQIVIFQHGMFSENVNPNWPDNPYNSANGGPLSRAEQFFYNDEARQRTRKLLRYIVARWGYASNLFAWELFNEVQFTGSHPNQSQQWRNAVITWHGEMSSYIRELDAFDHLVTTSAADDQLDDLAQLDGLDNVQYHLYHTDLLDVQADRDQALMAEVAPKGLINGEYGLDVNTADVPFDIQRLSIWTGIMSQVPHLMWLWENYHDPEWARLFQAPAAFLQNKDFTAEGILGAWEIDVSSTDENLRSVGFRTQTTRYGMVYRESMEGSASASISTNGLATGQYRMSLTDVVTGGSSEKILNIFPGVEDVPLGSFRQGVVIDLAYEGPITVPIAVAGADSAWGVGVPFSLDGTESYSPVEEPLEYSWQLIDIPQGSATTIEDASNAQATLTPDMEGIYLVSLRVSNSAGESEPDTLRLSVTANFTSVEDPFARLRVFPNPTRSVIYIEGLKEGNTIDLFDLVGKRPASVSTIKAGTAGATVLYPQNLKMTAGLYLLRVGDGKKYSFHRIVYIGD